MIDSSFSQKIHTNHFIRIKNNIVILILENALCIILRYNTHFKRQISIYNTHHTYIYILYVCKKKNIDIL